jgi:putative tryptophan/tyrosine transport system substrate-binding protein
VRRVGVLHFIPEQASLGFAAFRKELGELGYVVGQNIAIEYRWSDQAQRLPALAVELTGLRTGVIVTGDMTTTFAAEQTTKDIPIVAAVLNGDPVATSLADSFRRPGGNVTGLSVLAPEMAGKRLELLREIIPSLTRVAILWSRPPAVWTHRIFRTRPSAADARRCPPSWGRSAAALKIPL